MGVNHNSLPSFFVSSPTTKMPWLSAPSHRWVNHRFPKPSPPTDWTKLPGIYCIVAACCSDMDRLKQLIQESARFYISNQLNYAARFGAPVTYNSRIYYIDNMNSFSSQLPGKQKNGDLQPNAAKNGWYACWPSVTFYPLIDTIVGCYLLESAELHTANSTHSENLEQVFFSAFHSCFNHKVVGNWRQGWGAGIEYDPTLMAYIKDLLINAH